MQGLLVGPCLISAALNWKKLGLSARLSSLLAKVASASVIVDSSPNLNQLTTAGMASALEDTTVTYEDLAEIEKDFDDVETEISGFPS